MPFCGDNADARLLLLQELHRRRDELGTLKALIGKYVRADLFPELDAHVGSLYATTEGEIRRVVEPPQARYEVGVADAAEALGISESAVRKWDEQGCPTDERYPGRFSAVVFYQWAQTYQSKKRFLREAKKRAISNNGL